jgi:nitrogenase subunit NifH
MDEITKTKSNKIATKCLTSIPEMDSVPRIEEEAPTFRSREADQSSIASYRLLGNSLQVPERVTTQTYEQVMEAGPSTSSNSQKSQSRSR